MPEEQVKILNEFVELLTAVAKEVFNASQLNDIIGNGDQKDAIAAIIGELSKEFGVSFAEVKLAHIADQLESKFSHDLFGQAIIPMLPGGFLEERRLQSLSKEELYAWVVERTRELTELNAELEEKVRNRTEDLQELLESQHKAGKLLVRRDLELSRVNEKLLELDQRKSEFLSVAAHQLRTPLSGIKWTLGMIVKGELGAITNDQKVFLMKSFESNERMIKLVNDMLDADRLESGREQSKLIKTQLLDLVDNVLCDIMPLALKRNIHVEFDRGDASLPLIMIDQEKMRAVLQNLLDNAVKYSREGGTVGISAKQEGNMLVFSIKDSGIGIPIDQQALVFTRFFRARNAQKVETDGTGLGLFIVKSIIEMHGGKVSFESKEGVGTKFLFSIKLNNE
ncbi:MAG: HAMP domain-containing histidine kinase [Candidatus Taylorbacteria bacterium]|nr:HAMP domain-containing histidine kinase [Candidatus Taylorbacteria bacterium]